MMATHPSGITVKVVGIEASSNGSSCEEHDVCGSILAEDVVVRLRKVQIVNAKEGMEETAIPANWVSDGIDCCCMGFLQRHLVKHSKHYDGALAQITEIYSAESETRHTACDVCSSPCMPLVDSSHSQASLDIPHETQLLLDCKAPPFQCLMALSSP
jgi:hypothetical protein